MRIGATQLFFAEKPVAESLAYAKECGYDSLELVVREKAELNLGVDDAALKGMRKEAVVLAIGYPPRRDTPSLDNTIWRYWSSRLSFFLVEFDASGKVAKVTY